MASRAKEYANKAELAEIGGVVSYVVAGLFLLATVVSGGVLLGSGLSPLPALFPLGGSGVATLAGRRCMKNRDKHEDAAHAERELAEV